MRFRKTDYVVFYVISLILFGLNVMKPAKISIFVFIIISATFPALLLGTITNLLSNLFKKI